MAEDLYLKRTKTKGNTYYKIFKRVPGGKDQYIRMAGTATALNDKLVLLETLKGQDQQLNIIRDQLLKTRNHKPIDQQSNNKENAELSEEEE